MSNRSAPTNIEISGFMIDEILGSYGEFATFGYLAFVVTIATTGSDGQDRTSDMFLVQKPTEIL